MRVDVRKIEDIIIVDLDGDLVAGDGEEVLREVVDELVAEGWRKVLLNLSAVPRIDSSGVGELVASWRLGQRFGASLKLLRAGDRVRQTLHLSQVLPLLEVYEDEGAALEHFRSA
jgi:anti-anti-sigma factor